MQLLPRNEKIKITAPAANLFRSRIQIVADAVEFVRAGMDGIGRLMEVSLEHGGIREGIAFREWLLRQNGLSEAARSAAIEWRF